MIGTEFLEGQGLGNQLFCYVTARAIATDAGVDFGFVHPERLGNVVHSRQGMYFMDIDMGVEINPDEAAGMNVIHEADERIYLGNSHHDIEHGCYISGCDDAVLHAPDGSLLYGNLQSEEYFKAHLDEIKDWLKVRPEHESYEYTADDLCIINIRGGEYTSQPELFLPRRYYLNAIAHMRSINPDMRFMVITEDEKAARRVLPEYECHHFDMGKDYVTVKNARYLILSNSSFAMFPVMTSTELKYAIAPKYWARHNVSDGYWASEQNIYSFLHYMDRSGRIWEPDECKAELDRYKAGSVTYKRVGVKPSSGRAAMQKVRAKAIWYRYFLGRIVLSLLRRMHIIKNVREEE